MKIKRKSMAVDGVEIKDAMFDILASARINGVDFAVYASTVAARNGGGLEFKNVVIEASERIEEQEADQIGEDLLMAEVARLVWEENLMEQRR